MQKYIKAILIQYLLYAIIAINNYYILFYKSTFIKYWLYYNYCDLITYKLVINPLF